MIIDNTYDYRNYNKEENNRNRLYIIDESTKVPSVTTILDRTMKQEKREILENWRKRVGEKEAARILNTSSSLGTIMHKSIEDYYSSGKSPSGNPLAIMMALTIIKNSRFEKVYGCEVSLHHSNLYAGTADCVALEDGQLSIVDFKNSVSMKTDEMIEDYFLQLAAYAMAHDYMFDTEINRGTIKMATQDGKFNEFEKTGSEFAMFKEQWAKRLEEYYDLAK